MTIVAAPAVVVPRESAEPAKDRQNDWVATMILFMPLVGVTFLAKFAFVINGSELIMGVPAILGATLIGILTGRLKADSVRMMFYLGMVAIMVGLSVFAVKSFITSSLMLVVLVPLAHAFKLHGVGNDGEVHLRRIRNLTFFFCLLGIAQYFAQFAIGMRYSFPIENFTPDSIIRATKTYNSIIPLKYGSSTYKANGVFMLEPSYYSQTLAAGFVLEAAGPRRLLRLGAYLAGFMVAYSGTGFLMLAPGLAVLIILEKRFEIFFVMAIIGAVAVLFAKPLGLEVFLERATEFGSNKSSGYMRYVGGFGLFEQYLWPYPQRALFGMGSGMMFRSTPWSLYYVAETGWVKILIEFGLVGFIAYFGFLFFSVYNTKHSMAVRATISVTLMLSGILDPWSHSLILSLLVWMPPSLKQPALQPQPAVHPVQPAVPHTVHAPPVQTTQPGTALARRHPSGHPTQQGAGGAGMPRVPNKLRSTLRGQGPR